MTTSPSSPASAPRARADIQSVARAAMVLDLLVRDRGSITLRQAADTVGVDRTTMHRYLGTMESVGLVRRMNDGTKAGHYAFGPLAHQIAGVIAGETRVTIVAGERLQRIADSLGATAVLSLPSRGSAVVTDSAFPQDVPITVRISAGYTIPVEGVQSVLLHAFADDPETFATAIRSLPVERRDRFRADVEAARTQGYFARAVGDDLRVIATPIFDRRGVVATLGVIGLAAQLTRDHATAVPFLVNEAKAITDLVTGAGGD